MAKEVLELEVKSNIKAAAGDMDTLAKSTDEAAKENEALNKSTGIGTIGFGRLKTAVQAFGTALKALGVGLIIAAFVALQEALSRNQKVMNTVNSVMSAVSTTFNQVVDVLVDTYNWVTKSGERFNGLTKVISGLMKIALTPLKLAFYAIKLGIEEARLAWEKSFLGSGDPKKIKELTVGIKETKEAIAEVAKEAINAGADVINNFSDAIGEIGEIGKRVIDGVSEISIKANLEQAKATIAAQNSAKLAEAQLQGLIEKNDLLAEKQRQIRDSEKATFAERLAANKELGRVLEQQEVDMLKLADTRVAAAAFELEQNKDNIDLQIAYIQTLNDRAGVEAQVAGFKSEQLTNQESLEKELLETQREIRAEGLEGMEQELEELKTSYEAKVEMARKAGMDITDITAQYEKDQTDIKKKEADKQKALDKAVKDAKVGIAMQGLKLVGDIAGEGTEIAKAAAVAQATISGIEGVQNAFTTAQKSPITLGFPGYPFVQAGLAGAFSAIQIQKILSGAKPGPSDAPPSPDTAPPAPQMMSGAFDISGGVAPEAVKAYVVTDEMSNSQNQLANIRRRATI